MVALSKGKVTYCKPHHYGSRLLYAGTPENDVADWMGHRLTRKTPAREGSSP